MSEIIIPSDQKGYQCEIILDSISPHGVRLVTMRWKYPRFVHAEACRHRAFSRSVGSSRAIPTARMVAMVEQDPVVPIYWGKNQGGMQANEELSGNELIAARVAWNCARRFALNSARALLASGLHKQIVNRVLEPFLWVTEVVTATDWNNFFTLRVHPSAQPEILHIAAMALYAFSRSKPREIRYGQWHLPFITSEDYNVVPADRFLETLKKISAARVARTSYRTHEGKVSTVEEDLTLYNRLVGSQPIHASPTEHLATPNCASGYSYVGNLRGWKSHRFEIPGHTVRD